MSDIVERLRRWNMRQEMECVPPDQMMDEAANEIERLRKCLRIAKRDMMATDLSRQRLKKANA